MKLREAARNTKNVTMIEATAKDIVKNEVTGQVLGLVVKRKESTEQEYVSWALLYPNSSLTNLNYSSLLLSPSLPTAMPRTSARDALTPSHRSDPIS